MKILRPAKKVSSRRIMDQFCPAPFQTENLLRPGHMGRSCNGCRQ